VIYLFVIYSPRAALYEEHLIDAAGNDNVMFRHVEWRAIASNIDVQARTGRWIPMSHTEISRLPQPIVERFDDYVIAFRSAQ
jgi:hypothetical protein